MANALHVLTFKCTILIALIFAAGCETSPNQGVESLMTSTNNSVNRTPESGLKFAFVCNSGQQGFVLEFPETAAGRTLYQDAPNRFFVDGTPWPPIVRREGNSNIYFIESAPSGGGSVANHPSVRKETFEITIRSGSRKGRGTYSGQRSGWKPLKLEYCLAEGLPPRAPQEAPNDCHPADSSRWRVPSVNTPLVTLTMAKPAPR